MTDEQINIAIAEACGWKRGYTGTTQWVNDPHGIRMGWSDLRDVADAALPDYVNDLNAMHEAEDNLLGLNKAEFAVQLCRVVGRDWPSGIGGGSFAHVHATAAQRAEAFLRTLGKWEGVKP